MTGGVAERKEPLRPALNKAENKAEKQGGKRRPKWRFYLILMSSDPEDIRSDDGRRCRRERTIAPGAEQGGKHGEKQGRKRRPKPLPQS